MTTPNRSTETTNTQPPSGSSQGELIITRIFDAVKCYLITLKNIIRRQANHNIKMENHKCPN